MNRKEFGILVAALRQDLGWTQFQLAEYGGLDLADISLIERGARKNLDPEGLVKLANAFQLTTVERKEFLFAATGIGNEHIVRQPSAGLSTDAVSAEKALAKMIDLLERLPVPAFLNDAFSDIVAANSIAQAFMQIPAEMIADAAGIPGGYNTMRAVFGKDMAVRSHIVGNWDQYARTGMWTFRQTSLRYRAHPCFKYLLNAFRNPMEYPLFDRYWRMVSSVEVDQEADYQEFSYEHDTMGHLNYIATFITSLTTHGELVLVQYQPLSNRTKAIFDRLLAENGHGVLRVAPWPVKSMP
jgi:transcriptional regulator with XRE-family HTH domain